MHDWCISRQLWWGHRIPVWYGPDDASGVPRARRGRPAGPGWPQDPDVLDTWFSSALWPFSTMGWPETHRIAARKFYPTWCCVTGYDILFFWVVRMMMFGLYARARPAAPPKPCPSDRRAARTRPRPVRQEDVEVPRQHRRSTTAGSRFGADAVRLTLARGANPGTDQAVAKDWVPARRTSARSCSMPPGSRCSTVRPWRAFPTGRLTPADRWILSG